MIHGDNNKIIIGKNVLIGSGCSLWIEGCNSVIEIGDDSTFTKNVHLCAQENSVSIKIGSDCMFSNSIIVRTSDSHPIYNNEGNRTNPAKNVVIGNHVWIAPN